ncbi:MAG: sodium:calcium symporter [Acidobacteria bacterium]|nr:MAG: sodium:calcium symporter [Acidobacteriota bacterium]
MGGQEGLMANSSGPTRERWGTRIGLILAAAGNAIGIGNLLRFPSQAAQNGGGAFMIPYIVSLLLFGLPMMWVAWTVGRMGGRWGHGTTPGIFDRLAGGRPWAKYLGVIGVALPMVFVLYYAYIEAWCLGYSWFSFRGAYSDPSVDLRTFYNEFLGNATTSNYFSGVGVALLFMLITLALNVWILYRGIQGGIELLAKIAIPLLMVFCLVLGVRVLTLGQIKGTVADGLNFLWTPHLDRLLDFNVWMAAAGQIFFTLSIGFGSLECYGSYLKEDDDIALTGLTTASLNEFVEVIFGSMIAIPAAAVYYGAGQVEAIAKSGGYAIGMVSMPEILRGIGGVEVFGSMWFLLLFFAAFTSSVAVAQPVMSFLQDEARLSRAASAAVLGLLWLLGSVPVVFFYRYGSLDEMDFWSGTIGLVVFAIFEVVLFAWVFGIDRGWQEMNRGAQIRIPVVFRFIIRWVTPAALVAIFAGWFFPATMNGSLIASPKLYWGVIDAGSIGGRVTEHLPERGSLEEARLKKIEERFARAVTKAGRDLRAWANVTLNPAAPPAVDSVGGDPELLAEFGRRDLQEWLAARGLRFEPEEGSPSRSVALSLAIEGRYRETAIWMTRIVMLGFLFGFGVMVWAIWLRRSAGEDRA